MPEVLEMLPGNAVPVGDIPVVSAGVFRRILEQRVESGDWLAALFGCPVDDKLLIVGVLACPRFGMLRVMAFDPGPSYPALTPGCLEAHWFEREIHENWGVIPGGHPWLKPVRFTGAGAIPGVTDYFTVTGDEVHEVAVGPVHAGIIEPGHFRFQCHGEDVLHLEISLGYQHRGVERALVGGPDGRTSHYMETLAGDTSVGHATAGAEIIEALSGVRPSDRALALRAVALELERMANHTGDLGALAGDVAFLPTAAYCGRLRGEFLGMTAVICGSRMGRGMIRPGGVGFDVDPDQATELLGRLEPIMRDFTSAVRLLWDSPSVTSRFEHTGRLTRHEAVKLGLVGPAARASGVPRDVRINFPTGWYRQVPVLIALKQTGDVMGRARVRWQETHQSASLIRQTLNELPSGTIREPVGALQPSLLAVSLVEGWRGAICHVALTDDHGRFAAYKIVDPSFHNWFGLARAMRRQQISDFPLCNKSFNLSYCGHDL
jgi:Ni,Fe-hydrogenase III large subunit